MRARMTNLPSASATPGLLRRIAAMLYDGLLLVALWFAMNTLLLVLSGGRLADADRPDWLLYVQRLVLTGVTFGFFAWFWMHGGQTLGMRAWRLRLEDELGGPISLNQAAKRSLAALISFAALGLGYFWVLVDRENRSWHDRYSGTRLVLVAKGD